MGHGYAANPNFQALHDDVRIYSIFYVLLYDYQPPRATTPSSGHFCLLYFPRLCYVSQGRSAVPAVLLGQSICVTELTSQIFAIPQNRELLNRLLREEKAHCREHPAHDGWNINEEFAAHGLGIVLANANAAQRFRPSVLSVGLGLSHLRHQIYRGPRASLDGRVHAEEADRQVVVDLLLQPSISSSSFSPSGTDRRTWMACLVSATPSPV